MIICKELEINPDTGIIDTLYKFDPDHKNPLHLVNEPFTQKSTPSTSGEPFPKKQKISNIKQEQDDEVLLSGVDFSQYDNVNTSSPTTKVYVAK